MFNISDKALRQCNKMGCSELTRNGYCKEHQYILEEQKSKRNQYYNQNRDDKKEQDFYKTTAWRDPETGLRIIALKRDNFLCQYCLAKKKIVSAHTVHHIKPIKKHWQLRLTLTNLVSLCDSCHNSIDHRQL